MLLGYSTQFYIVMIYLITMNAKRVVISQYIKFWHDKSNNFS